MHQLDAGYQENQRLPRTCTAQGLLPNAVHHFNLRNQERQRLSPSLHGTVVSPSRDRTSLYRPCDLTNNRGSRRTSAAVATARCKATGHSISMGWRRHFSHCSTRVQRKWQQASAQYRQKGYKERLHRCRQSKGCREASLPVLAAPRTSRPVRR